MSRAGSSGASPPHLRVPRRPLVLRGREREGEARDDDSDRRAEPGDRAGDPRQLRDGGAEARARSGMIHPAASPKHPIAHVRDITRQCEDSSGIA